MIYYSILLGNYHCTKVGTYRETTAEILRIIHTITLIVTLTLTITHYGTVKREVTMLYPVDMWYIAVYYWVFTTRPKEVHTEKLQLKLLVEMFHSF